MSKIYYQERNHPNWSGRVPRQSRITGTWSEMRKADRIPPSAYVCGALAIVVLWLANWL